MRKVSMATRRELVEAVGERYRAADRTSKGRVLDEFVAVTGLHRKHAMRILREKAPSRQTARPERRIYTEAVRTALILLWEASDRLCGKRLRPLIPILIEAMEGHGHLDLEPAIKAKLLQMSAATIDRALKTVRESSPRLRRRGVAGSELTRLVQQRTELVNMLRAFLYELGHVVPQGVNNLPRIAAIITESNSDLPEIARIECRDLLEQIEAMTVRIATSDRRIKDLAGQADMARRLQTMPGVGPMPALVVEAFAPCSATITVSGRRQF